MVNQMSGLLERIVQKKLKIRLVRRSKWRSNMTNQETLAKNKHISNETIIKDIYDTTSEIEQLDKEASGLEIIGDRLSLFTASAKRNEIKRRQEFILNLQKLLNLRGYKNKTRDCECFVCIGSANPIHY